MTSIEAATHKVFVSHASEDKAMAERLAVQLRKSGIDAWVDFWEIKRGDSLVDKIFSHGLKGADVFMILLSKDSIKKPWVKEELDAALVSRISGQMRIMPVKVDECETPMALKATRWSDLKEENFESEVQGIIDDIYGKTTKPSLGKRPAYVNQSIIFDDNLNNLDNALFKMIYDALFDIDTRDGQTYKYFNAGPENEWALELEATADSVIDSVIILSEQNLVEHIPVMGGGLGSVEGTSYGWSVYFKNTYPSFEDTILNISAILVRSNDGIDASVIASSLDIPYKIVETVFSILESQGYMKVERYSGGQFAINISPRLKRKVLGNT